jgi:DNA polymerase-3 subunit gamma/tau
MNNRAYQERLQQALEQHTGAKIRLEISVGEVDGKTVAAARDSEQKQQLSAAAAAIDRDPFVREVIENFDAKVVPASIKSTH